MLALNWVWQREPKEAIVEEISDRHFIEKTFGEVSLIRPPKRHDRISQRKISGVFGR